MTLAITHAFVSAKGDGADATLVRPSNWNAGHATSMANNQILGNVSGGTGPVVEIPATSFALAALAATDGPSFLAALGLGGFSTGDTKFSINPTALTGWIVYQGAAATISDATGTGTARNNNDCSALFQMIWNQINNTYCPVLGGRGANALADWNAHKQITLPWFSGHAMIGAGSGGGLTSRAAGVYGGEETHILLLGELATHTHVNTLTDPGHTHAIVGSSGAGGGIAVVNGASGTFGQDNHTGTSGVNGTGITINNSGQGSSNPFNLMQPFIGMWVHLKL